MSVAYRLTGTVADAEDIVQEAWLRWDAQERTDRRLRAWLTTVVSRLGWTGCGRPLTGAKPIPANGYPNRW